MCVCPFPSDPDFPERLWVFQVTYTAALVGVVKWKHFKGEIYATCQILWQQALQVNIS